VPTGGIPVGLDGNPAPASLKDDERVHVPKPPGYFEGEDEDLGAEVEEDLSRVGIGIGIAMIV
jgi:hypothetical protein